MPAMPHDRVVRAKLRADPSEAQNSRRLAVCAAQLAREVIATETESGDAVAKARGDSARGLAQRFESRSHKQVSKVHKHRVCGQGVR